MKVKTPLVLIEEMAAIGTLRIWKKPEPKGRWEVEMFYRTNLECGCGSTLHEALLELKDKLV